LRFGDEQTVEWHQLAYFRAVARLEHVGRAALELDVSQSAVSRAVALLERELGMPLFDRRGRSVALNRFGRLFLTRVDRAFGEIDEGVREIADADGAASGVIGLAFLHSFGVDLVPRLIRTFRRGHPNVSFELRQNSGEAVVAALEAGNVDLCISVPHLFDHGNVHWNTLLTENLLANVSADHRLAKRASVRLAELADEPFILMKHGYVLRSVVDTAMQDAGIVPKIAFEGEEIGTTRGLVAAGLGVALLPPSPRRLDGVRELRVRDAGLKRDIGIGWMDDRYLSRAATAFREFVVAGRDRPAVR